MSRPHIFGFETTYGLGTDSYKNIVIANSIPELLSTHLYFNWALYPRVLITQEIRDEFKFTGYALFHKDPETIKELDYDFVLKLYSLLDLCKPTSKTKLLELLDLVIINWHE